MGYKNPLLKLPAMRVIMALPADQRGPLEALMRELRADADRLAEESWRKRKGSMAAYWRAVSTYARHVAHALSKGHQVAAPGVAPSPASSIVAELRSAIDDCNRTHQPEMAATLQRAIDALTAGVPASNGGRPE